MVEWRWNLQRVRWEIGRGGGKNGEEGGKEAKGRKGKERKERTGQRRYHSHRIQYLEIETLRKRKINTVNESKGDLCARRTQGVASRIAKGIGRPLTLSLSDLQNSWVNKEYSP